MGKRAARRRKPGPMIWFGSTSGTVSRPRGPRCARSVCLAQGHGTAGRRVLGHGFATPHSPVSQAPRQGMVALAVDNLLRFKCQTRPQRRRSTSHGLPPCTRPRAAPLQPLFLDHRVGRFARPQMLRHVETQRNVPSVWPVHSRLSGLFCGPFPVFPVFCVFS